MSENFRHFIDSHLVRPIRGALAELATPEAEARMERAGEAVGRVVSLNRRAFLAGGVATGLLLAGGGAAFLLRDKDKPGTGESPSNQPNCQEKPIDQMFADLKKDFPELEKEPRLIFNIEDARVYHFLECSSLQSLATLGILKPAEELPYLNIANMWGKAVKRNGSRKPYSDKMQAAPNEKLSLESLVKGAASGIEQFSQKDVLKEADLDNDFSKYLTPELVVGIFIQEVTPGEVSGGSSKIRIKPKARLELFRMMIEAGWQPQKMPALYDSAISFGLGQMTLPTHKGLQRAYSSETEGIINHELIDHTSAKQQTNNVLLLSYANLDAFAFIAGKYPHFKEIFSKADNEQQIRFITTVLAAYHNYGDRPRLRKKIKQTLGQNIGDLEQYRTTFIENIKKLSIAYHHSRNSGTLYSFLMHRGCAGTISDKNAKEDGEATPETAIATPAESAEAEQEAKTAEDTLLVRRKASKAGRHEEMAYYTFTVPDVRLGEFMSNMLKGKTSDDVKAFNGVKAYKPGDVIHIPVKFLQDDLRDRKFVKIQIGEGQDIWKVAEQHMEGGISERNVALARLYGSTTRELRFPARLLKD